MGVKANRLTSALFFLLIHVLFVISADDNAQFQSDLTNLGIDPSTVAGCESGCSYDSESGVLTLMPGAYVANPPSGVVIELNGGSVETNGAIISGTGMYTGGTPGELNGGEISYNSLDKSVNINFIGSEVSLPKPAIGSVVGNGYIANGVLVIEDGDIQTKNSKVHVQNLAVDDSRVSPNKLAFTAMENAKIGNNADYVMIEQGRFVEMSSSEDIPHILVGYLLKTDGTGYDENSNPPTFVVHGAPSFYLSSAHVIRDELDDEGKRTGSEKIPYTVVVNNKPHSVIGDLEVKKGAFIIPGAISEVEHMVDGVYVSTYSDIPLFFDDKIRKGNFIALGNELHAGGSGYSIALSQEGVGRLSPDFYHHFQGGPYLRESAGSYSPDRFIVTFNGDEVVPGQEGIVTIDPVKKKVNSEGTLNVLTGTHSVQYFVESGKQEYNYKYVGCGGSISDDVHIFSCGSIPYTLEDSGVINIASNEVTSKGSITKTPLLHEGEKVDEVRVKFRDELGALQEKSLDFNSRRLYILGYKGGSAAEQTFGSERASEEWGHAGVLYHKDNQWWVAEADGVSTKIRPFKDSLFARNLAGAWEVIDDSGNPIPPDNSIKYVETLVGARYDLNPLTPNRIHCTEVAISCAEAGLQKPYQGRVTFNDLGAHEPSMSIVARSMAVAKVTPTPRWAFGSPNLKEIYIKPNYVNLSK